MRRFKGIDFVQSDISSITDSVIVAGHALQSINNNYKDWPSYITNRVRYSILVGLAEELERPKQKGRLSRGNS